MKRDYVLGTSEIKSTCGGSNEFYQQVADAYQSEDTIEVIKESSKEANTLYGK